VKETASVWVNRGQRLNFWAQGTFHRLKVARSVDCVDIGSVRKCAARVRDADPEHAILNDKQRGGRPRTDTDEAHRNRVDKMMKENRRFPEQAEADRTAISRERIIAIIADLRYRRLFARFVSRMLTEEQNQMLMNIRRLLMLWY
jgi:hypothetical protein